MMMRRCLRCLGGGMPSSSFSSSSSMMIVAATRSSAAHSSTTTTAASSASSLKRGLGGAVDGSSKQPQPSDVRSQMSYVPGAAELWREDTHGFRCRVGVYHSEEEAQAVKRELEREVHKQHYEIVLVR